MECDGKGYTITSENDGSIVRLDFDADQQTWSVDAGHGAMPFMTFVDDNHVSMPAADGTMQTVELSQAGVMAYSQSAATGLFASR